MRHARIWMLAATVVTLFFAPFVAPYDPMAVNTANQLMPPSQAHPFGTDLLGRDVFSRFLYGGQRTTLIAGAATMLAVGCALGLRIVVMALRRAGKSVLWTLNQAMLAVPTLALALTVTTLAGRGEAAVALAAGISQIAPLLRTLLVAERQALVMGHVEAARGLGAKELHLWRHHLLPIMLPGLMAYGGVIFAQALLAASALSFLGFGGEISTPEWGRMLYEGRQVLRAAAWVAIAPGLGITLLVTVVNRGLVNLRG